MLRLLRFIQGSALLFIIIILALSLLSASQTQAKSTRQAPSSDITAKGGVDVTEVYLTGVSPTNLRAMNELRKSRRMTMLNQKPVFSPNYKSHVRYSCKRAPIQVAAIEAYYHLYITRSPLCEGFTSF